MTISTLAAMTAAFMRSVVEKSVCRSSWRCLRSFADEDGIDAGIYEEREESGQGHGVRKDAVAGGAEDTRAINDDRGLNEAHRRSSIWKAKRCFSQRFVLAVLFSKRKI